MDLQWTFRHAQEPEGTAYVLNRIARLEAFHQAQLDGKQSRVFRRLLGEAIARVLSTRVSAGGDDSTQKLEQATQCLDQAEGYLLARSIENAREWSVRAAGMVAGLLMMMLPLLFYARVWLTAILGDFGWRLLFGAVVGSSGALFSVLSRVEKLPVDPSAGPCIHQLNNVVRIVVGVMHWSRLFKTPIGLRYIQEWQSTLCKENLQVPQLVANSQNLQRPSGEVVNMKRSNMSL